MYVYQQTEIFRLAYVDQRKLLLQDLVDKNSVLRYNIKKNESVVRIGSKVSGLADFQMPDTCRLVRLSTSRGAVEISDQPENRKTLIARLFGIKKEAEAKTFNP